MRRRVGASHGRAEVARPSGALARASGTRARGDLTVGPGGMVGRPFHNAVAGTEADDGKSATVDERLCDLLAAAVVGFFLRRIFRFLRQYVFVGWLLIAVGTEQRAFDSLGGE